MYKNSAGIFHYLLGSLLVVAPHCMGTKHVVSKLKSSSSSFNDPVTDRLITSINDAGTANYDPRPLAASFLQTKDRRYQEPQADVYQQWDFIPKFCRIDSTVWIFVKPCGYSLDSWYWYCFWPSVWGIVSSSSVLLLTVQWLSACMAADTVKVDV